MAEDDAATTETQRIQSSRRTSPGRPREAEGHDEVEAEVLEDGRRLDRKGVGATGPHGPASRDVPEGEPVEAEALPPEDRP